MTIRCVRWIVYGVLVLGAGAVGCAPQTFIRAAPGWKVIELREGMTYDEAWMVAVDTLTRDWDVEMMDKSSGYLRTAWHHGISSGPYQRYRGRITVKFPDVKKPTQVEVKTEAQWLETASPTVPVWITGYDTAFQRDVYTALGGRLSRVVPKE